MSASDWQLLRLVNSRWPFFFAFFTTKNTAIQSELLVPARGWSRVRAAFNEYIRSGALDAVQFVMTAHPPIGKDIIATD
jgi:hypothetical protein